MASKVKCKFYPYCSKKECPFIHPSNEYRGRFGNSPLGTNTMGQERSLPWSRGDDEFSGRNSPPMKIKIRCKFWPECHSVECNYHHPVLLCRNFPFCPYGERCLNIHPGDEKGGKEQKKSKKAKNAEKEMNRLRIMKKEARILTENASRSMEDVEKELEEVKKLFALQEVQEAEQRDLIDCVLKLQEVAVEENKSLCNCLLDTQEKVEEEAKRKAEEYIRSLEEIKKKFEANNGEALCAVCKNCVMQVKFSPCCHVVCCQSCARPLKSCPLCGRAIADRERIFIA